MEFEDSVTDEQFEDILKIRGAGSTEMTEVLFYVKPEKYFTLNGPSRPVHITSQIYNLVSQI